MPAALGAFQIPLMGAVASLFLGAKLNSLLRKRGRLRQANLALALMMVGLLACVHFSFVRFPPILSSEQLAAAVARHYRTGDVVVVDGEYHEASSLNFYTRIPLRVLHEPTGEFVVRVQISGCAQCIRDGRLIGRLVEWLCNGVSLERSR
jgi:hypothetical protein